MTNNNIPGRNGLSAKSAGRLSMISMLAISAGIIAAPAQAQSVIAPSDMPPSKMQMQSPVAVPQPAPAPPIQSGPAESPPVTEPIAPVTPDNADALATKGGFDATTVAPEALAQIESEQQARKAEAAKAAAAKTAATARARATSAPASIPADSGTDNMTMAAPVVAAGESAPVAAFDSLPPVIPAQTAPAAPEMAPADLPGDTDWNLLAALAALLGIGGVGGAYAASRRRKDRMQPPAAAYQSEPESDPVMAATMPELRRNRVEAEAEVRSAAQAEQPSPSTKADFAAFVGSLPEFEAPRSKADHHVSIAQRRVVAARPPYLGEADLSRREGYFTAHVDAIPTPQNPFLTRQKRLKRAQSLDSKLAEMKAANAVKPTRVTGTMQATRPLQPAYN